MSQAATKNTQSSKFSVRDICYTGLFAAVIAVMAQISIPMPLGVPMTMQTLWCWAPSSPPWQASCT